MLCRRITSPDNHILLSSKHHCSFWQASSCRRLQSYEVSFEFVRDRKLAHEFTVVKEGGGQVLWKRDGEGLLNLDVVLRHLHWVQLSQLLLDVTQDGGLLTAIGSWHEVFPSRVARLVLHVKRPVDFLSSEELRLHNDACRVLVDEFGSV